MQPNQLPTGTVTFVLGDVEGSVRLWESRRADMAVATARLDELVSQMVEAHGGARPVEQGEGDSFVAAFPIAHDAVAFVLAVQRAVGQADWATVLPLRLRASVHTGVAELRGRANYMGPTINRSARIRALAHGGQVLLSGAVAGLVTDDLPDGVSLVDQGVHPLRDFDRPEHVFQLAHPDLPERFPPLRAQGNAGRLPTALTTFVARTEELAAVRHLLERARLVTLTGAGGSGKTRLALEAARSLVGRFADGVAWADAAPISDGALVASCVAGAVEVREVPGEPPLDTLARELRHREALVVVDNCEHVLDEVAAVLERLLRDCPGLRVLATSREPIGVSGESAMRVPSLTEDAAVELFVERAAAARPGFSLSPSSEPAVRDVCRRLDGIPLAVELAASRVRMLSPQQIADGLADRFRLLTGGARTALPRQRTLEASVDWSYRLLSPAERELLSRLSVLAGGFDLAAATALCGDEGDEGHVLDVLSALVDKSLVQADDGGDDDGGDGDVRYLMLETIRHFARQRLADAADADAVRDRHLAHFLQLAEDIGPRIEQGDEAALLDRLDLDLDNLRAALDWAEQRGDVVRFLRLAAATWLYWEVRCRFEEGCARLRRAVALTDEPTRTRAMALYGLGDMSLFIPDIAQVVASGEEVVAIGRELDDAGLLARGTTLLGWAASYGAYQEPAWAVGALGELLGRLSIDTEPWLYLDAAIARGFAATAAGDIAGAGAMLDDAILSAGRFTSIGSLQRALFFRAWCHVLANEAADAVPLLGRAVELADDIDDTFIRALSTGVLAYAVLQQGDLAGAAQLAAEARAFGERYRNPFAMVLADTVDATAALCTGAQAACRAALARAMPVADAIGLGWIRAWMAGMAALLDLDRARLAAATATTFGGNLYGRGVLSLFRAWLERASGEAGAAEAAASAALADLTESGVRGFAASALDELGIGAVQREQHERAARLFAAADAERSRLGMARLSWTTVPSRDADVEAARAALGASVFDDEWNAGAALSLDAAVRFALRGKGGRRRPTSGWESLTPTELDVVRLVSEGLSNPAIAEKLFISRGTVKVHLSHAFTKLGVTSRAELAAAAARRE
ncbi:MAG: LuxR C-terminal-related transcriptional regulator [Actinobacteria bacterium]|nr:LuxR C-terminal-related transcriptional regulator [Actinomycetota bacterium]